MHKLFSLFFIQAAMLLAQYNGTTTGTITYSSGTASGFNSTNYITLPAGAMPTAFPWCIETWTKPTTTTWEATLLGGNFSIGRGPGPFAYLSIGAYSVYAAPDIVAPGTSQHLVLCSLDGTSIRGFVNGTHIGTTSGTIPAFTGTPTIGNSSGVFTGEISELVIWEIDKYPGTTTFVPTATWADGSSGLRAIYHFNGNANDSKTITLGASAQVGAGFVLTIVGGTAPYDVQLQSYSGSCASGTFANDGSAVTGVAAGTTSYSRTATTAKCYRAVVTDAVAAVVNSNGITLPSGGGMVSH